MTTPLLSSSSSWSTLNSTSNSTTNNKDKSNYLTNNNNNHGHFFVKNRQLVIFIGPHKSASSSTEQFFVDYAGHSHKKHHDNNINNDNNNLIFSNWFWPIVETKLTKSRIIYQRKVMAHLVKGQKDLQQDILQSIQQQWQQQNNNHHEQRKNMILGSEEFDRLGPTPHTKRNAKHTLQTLISFLQPKPDIVSFVINYRIPRADQWISIWKQYTHSRNTPYQEFMTSPNHKASIIEALNTAANPLGIASILHQAFPDSPIYIMDMSGLQPQQDIAHAIACLVLTNVTCNEHGQIEGLQNITYSVNTKKRKHDLSEQQLQDIETWLQYRDCAYQHELLSSTTNNNNNNNNSKITIVQANKIWQNCDSQNSEIYNLYKNTSYLLDKLQSHFLQNYSNNDDNDYNNLQSNNITTINNTTNYHKTTSKHIINNNNNNNNNETIILSNFANKSTTTTATTSMVINATTMLNHNDASTGNVFDGSIVHNLSLQLLACFIGLGYVLCVLRTFKAARK